MSTSPIAQTIDVLSREKNIDPNVIISAIEEAVIKAARKQFNAEQTGEENPELQLGRMQHAGIAGWKGVGSCREQEKPENHFAPQHPIRLQQGCGRERLEHDKTAERDHVEAGGQPSHRVAVALRQ